MVGSVVHREEAMNEISKLPSYALARSSNGMEPKNQANPSWFPIQPRLSPQDIVPSVTVCHASANHAGSSGEYAVVECSR